MIPNPLLDNVHASEAELAGERRREFLFVGRIHPEKGIGLLLQAFATYAETTSDPWKLVVVGPWETHLGGGGEDYFNRLRGSIPESCKPLIEWAGFVADAAGLKSRLLEAGLFLYPTIAAKGEASPVAPLEAMGCGCPVLVSDLDCFKGLIEDGETGFVFNPAGEDPAGGLARRLEELAGSSGLRQKVGRAGWHRAETLALGKIADLYLEDFAAVLG
jgi:glycosyltransferase involved in cell wall biosynthesis